MLLKKAKDFLRYLGKKELAQLSVYDLVFILLISNAVQNATAISLSHLWKGNSARSPMLVFKGEILFSHLEKARITEDELMEVIREHGVASVSEVDLAVLEVDGNISVLSTDIRKKTIRRRKAHKVISKQQ